MIASTLPAIPFVPVFYMALEGMSERAKRQHEALVRIAGTPTKNSTTEAKDMARAANEALSRRPPRSFARIASIASVLNRRRRGRS
jgi:hypothetical protein